MPRLRSLVVCGLCTAWLVSACRDPAGDESPSQPPTAGGREEIDAPAPVAPVDAAARTAEPKTPAPVVETFGPAKLARFDDRQREQLLAGEADDPIPVDIHYVQSNETRHDLYFPYIATKGGAYVGVGSDQNYTMIAAARSEVAFLLDIDFRVVDLHRMYEILIREHDDPRALVDAWHEKNEATSKALIAEALADASERERSRILRGFATGRETVYRHLERVIARKRSGEPASWLSDPEHYAHVRALWQTGRIRAMPGDLAGAKSLQTVAAACKALAIPVRVLYMSNAEEYFKYTAQFVANIDAMPLDESGSMVLRTIYNKKWVHADLWAYQVQPLSDFRARLADRKKRSRNPMLRYAEIDGKLVKDTGQEGLTLVAIEPAAAKADG
jgi:hypothetical protein